MGSGYNAQEKNQSRGFCSAQNNLLMCCLIAAVRGRAFICKTKEKNNLVYLSKMDFGFQKQGKMYVRDEKTNSP